MRSRSVRKNDYYRSDDLLRVGYHLLGAHKHRESCARVQCVSRYLKLFWLGNLHVHTCDIESMFAKHGMRLGGIEELSTLVIINDIEWEEDGTRLWGMNFTRVSRFPPNSRETCWRSVSYE